MRKGKLRFVSLMAAAALALGCAPENAMRARAAEEDLSQYYVEVYDTVKYQDFLDDRGGASRPAAEITVPNPVCPPRLPTTHQRPAFPDSSVKNTTQLSIGLAFW